MSLARTPGRRWIRRKVGDHTIHSLVTRKEKPFTTSGSLVFIDADGSSRINSKCIKLYFLFRFMQMINNSQDTTDITVQMDNEPKHTVKSSQELLNAKKWNVFKFQSLSTQLSMLYTEIKTEG